MRKKIAFVDNQVGGIGWPQLTTQMVSSAHTNITPAKLEEFESTFKHFDKDGTNVSGPSVDLADRSDPERV